MRSCDTAFQLPLFCENKFPLMCCTNTTQTTTGAVIPELSGAVIPHLHNTSHRLKNIASRINVKVVLSAPKKINQT